MNSPLSCRRRQTDKEVVHARKELDSRLRKYFSGLRAVDKHQPRMGPLALRFLKKAMESIEYNLAYFSRVRRTALGLVKARLPEGERGRPCRFVLDPALH